MKITDQGKTGKSRAEKKGPPTSPAEMKKKIDQ